MTGHEGSSFSRYLRFLRSPQSQSLQGGGCGADPEFDLVIALSHADQVVVLANLFDLQTAIGHLETSFPG